MLLKTFVYLMTVYCLVGCASSRSIIYFQDLDNDKLLKNVEFNEVRIQKDDMLSILVSGPDKEVIQPYNLTISEGSNLGDFQRTTVGYLVNSTGEIKFPILGKIKVEGMTRAGLEEYLVQEIGKDVKDPVVSISFKNFKITILGEVRSPGTFTINSEKINLLQALGLAGDLLISGKREDVLLMRSINGRQIHIKINLKTKEILESPYFYLQQNDVLYIPPSVSRIAQGRTATGVWGTVISSVSVLATVLVLIFK